MFSPDEAMQTTKGYLNKLTRVINYQATFTWFKTKIIKKTRIDDILCCIEGSFPNEYKDFVRKQGSRGLRGYTCYQQLVMTLRNKSMLFSDSYSVDSSEAIRQIQVLGTTLKSDFVKVCNSFSNEY